MPDIHEMFSFVGPGSEPGSVKRRAERMRSILDKLIDEMKPGKEINWRDVVYALPSDLAITYNSPSSLVQGANVSLRHARDKGKLTSVGEGNYRRRRRGEAAFARGALTTVERASLNKPVCALIVICLSMGITAPKAMHGCASADVKRLFPKQGQLLGAIHGCLNIIANLGPDEIEEMFRRSIDPSYEGSPLKGLR